MRLRLSLNKPKGTSEEDSVSLGMPSDIRDNYNYGNGTFDEIILRLHVNDPTLSEVDLSLRKLDVGRCDQLADALKNNFIVTHLYLVRNNLKMKGLVSICQALKKNRTITSLAICENGIGDQGAELLSDVLRRNKTLKELRLKTNNISDDGVASIALLLHQNNRINLLALCNNAITCAGAKVIASSLVDGTQLTTLKMRGNEIGPDGAKHLAKALRNNCTLTELSLMGNKLGNDGAAHLSNFCLMHNSTISYLDLGDNCIGSTGMCQISHALQWGKCGSCLLELILKKNFIGDLGVKRLSQVLVGIAQVENVNEATSDSNLLEAKNAKAIDETTSGRGETIRIPSLLSIDLSWNGVSNSGVENMLSLLENHQTSKITQLMIARGNTQIDYILIKKINTVLEFNRSRRERMVAWSGDPLFRNRTRHIDPSSVTSKRFDWEEESGKKYFQSARRFTAGDLRSSCRALMDEMDDIYSTSSSVNEDETESEIPPLLDEEKLFTGLVLEAGISSSRIAGKTGPKSQSNAVEVGKQTTRSYTKASEVKDDMACSSLARRKSLTGKTIF